MARSDGSVVAVGHTKGTLGEASRGDNDAFAKSFDATGKPLWTTQFGTDTDDRGATAAAQSDGSIQVVGTTYGQMGAQVGGVDVFTAQLAADGTLGVIDQFGSNERDGADEWDDANLFATPAKDGLWITGLTFGAPAGQTNAGAGDVFVELRKVGEEPSPEPTEEPTEEPTGEPTDTPSLEPTGEPTTEPTGEPTSTPTDNPTSEPTGKETSEPITKPVDGSGDKDLAKTGVNALPVLGAGLLLALVGATVLVGRRIRA